jgi:MFS family permease
MLWAALSERYGRRPPLLLGYLGYIVLQIPIGAAANITSILIPRFLCGLFGVTSSVIAGGALADLWEPQSRSITVMLFVAGNLVSLVIGPVLAAFVVNSAFGWRWIVWIPMILSSVSLFAAWYFVSETYSLVIFQQRAQDMRLQYHNWAYHAELDEERVGIREVFTRHLLRPLVMFVTERILFLMSFYLMFVYGLLFLFGDSYPVVFESRGWRGPEIATLPFLLVALGIIIGSCALIWWDRYNSAHGHDRERRLIQIISGGLILTIGLFWFAATSNPNSSWVPLSIGGVFIGCGIFMIFVPGLNYTLDIYRQYANSAVAATTLGRNLAAAAVPLFATQMYRGLGAGWASAFLGFISLSLTPIPVFLLFQERKSGMTSSASQRDRVSVRHAISLPLEISSVQFPPAATIA